MYDWSVPGTHSCKGQCDEAPHKLMFASPLFTWSAAHCGSAAEAQQPWDKQRSYNKAQCAKAFDILLTASEHHEILLHQRVQRERRREKQSRFLLSYVAAVSENSHRALQESRGRTTPSQATEATLTQWNHAGKAIVTSSARHWGWEETSLALLGWSSCCCLP